MAYNPLDTKLIDKEVKQFLFSNAMETPYPNRIYQWRKRFEKKMLSPGKKIEILLTYGDFELTKKKN